MAHRKDWSFIKTIQRVFRIRMLIKRSKKRFLEAIRDGEKVHHQCVVEFYENPKDEAPSNYMIIVNEVN
jgi:hypothetical protein